MMHGRLGGMQVLGVPGNPVSSYVCAFLFLVPLIRRLAGRHDLSASPARARLGRDLPANDERADYLRATLAEDPTARWPRHVPAPGQFPDGAIGQGGLPADSGTARARGPGRFRLCHP